MKAKSKEPTRPPKPRNALGWSELTGTWILKHVPMKGATITRAQVRRALRELRSLPVK
jgi:hypothetical protein